MVVHHDIFDNHNFHSCMLENQIQLNPHKFLGLSAKPNNSIGSLFVFLIPFFSLLLAFHKTLFLKETFSDI